MARKRGFGVPRNDDVCEGSHSTGTEGINGVSLYEILPSCCHADRALASLAMKWIGGLVGLPRFV